MASPMGSVGGLPESNPRSEFEKAEGDSPAAADIDFPQAGAQRNTPILTAPLPIGQDSSPSEKKPKAASGTHPQPELGHLGTSAPAEAEVLREEMEASDIPDSVKAWYAMPVGPPVKSAKRYFRRRVRRPAAFIDDSAPIEPSATGTDESGGFARPVMSDENVSQRNAGTAIWRLAGLTAMAAAAGAMFVIHRPHGSPSMPFLASSSQPSTLPLLPDTGRATRSSATPPVATTSALGDVDGLSLAAGIALPNPLPGPTAAGNHAAAGAPRPSRSGRATGKSSRMSYSSSRRRLEGRQYSTSNDANGDPCEGQKGRSHRVAESFAPQRPAVSRFLRTIGRHLLQLTGRKNRMG